MPKLFQCIGMILCSTLCAASVRASELEATLDRYEIRARVGTPTVLQVTLRNKGSEPVYLTGVKVSLSPGASGDLYNPALIHENLRKIDAGQSWDGPLIEIRSHHRGPLVVKGSIRLTGGATQNSTDTIASIPLQFSIDDPRRNTDGTYDRSAVPVCDRSAERCCDPLETNCYLTGDRCVYVAEGYDRQEVCVNHQAEKSYEYIDDLQVSTNTHLAYTARANCLSVGSDMRCKRFAVTDRTEKPLGK